jgi:hypothetical protein
VIFSSEADFARQGGVSKIRARYPICKHVSFQLAAGNKIIRSPTK